MQERAPSLTLSRANPFPGLRPYEEVDSNWFFGRGGEINELLKRLRRLHLIAVVGASGSGKSSLVRAGVLPHIRDGYLDSNWNIATFRPGEQPIENLARALQPDRIDKDFSDTMRSGSMGLVRAIQAQELPPDRKILILVDQFEELFQFARRTGDLAQEEVKEFLKLLLAAANSHDVDIYVVITMRLEWLTECAAYPGLAEAINEGIYLVPQMTRRQFQQAILGPLEMAGGSITTALLGRMLNDLDNRTDQLPVLQHALMRIWERVGAGDAFDTSDYEAVGTFSNCLSAHAEEVYGELNPRQKQVAESLFRNITQVHQNRKTRRPQPVSAILLAARATAAELGEVIEAFSRAGRSFLVTSEGALSPSSIVDVSHEALIRQWLRLCGWVEDEADKQSRVSRLEVDAAEWDRNRKQFKASLYRGYRLQRAEELRPALDPHSTALAFLNESSRARFRLRLVKRGSISLAIALVVGFSFLLYRVRAEGMLAVALAQSQRAAAEARAASLQAKKAQDFQQDLVKKIDAANGSATALAAIAKDIQAKRVYVQYVAADVQLARTVQTQLQKQGYAVPGIEAVDARKAPAETQVRFFHAEDRVEAAKVASRLRPLVADNVSVVQTSNPQDTVPAGQFEVWLTSTPVVASTVPASSPATPPPAPAAVKIAEPQISASASQDRVTAGRSVTLSWLTTNASEVQIDGVGEEGPRGTVTVTPQQTTTYRLTAKGEGGVASTTVAVEVIPAPVVAPAPVTPASSAGASETLAVKAALDRYREAYESESLPDVLKAWPSASKGDQSQMNLTFKMMNAIRIEWQDQDVHIDGTTATMKCIQTTTYTRLGKKQSGGATPTTYHLKKLAGGWVLDGIGTK
jgi:hypothetical protein